MDYLIKNWDNVSYRSKKNFSQLIDMMLIP